MSNALALIRTLVIYSLCLPLAIYLGYLVAMDLSMTTITIMVMVVFLPLVPFLLRWHHLLLFACWNTSAILFFLPGRPNLWLVMGAVSLTLSMLQHILNRNIKFLSVPSVTRPLIFLVVVIVITANLTGGFGLRSMGSEYMGGKRYFVLLGSKTISGETLLRWYVLHVLLLPFVIVIFMAVHFWRVRKDGGISGPL